MKEFIVRLFAQNGFIEKTRNNVSLFICDEENTKKSYWALTELQDLNFLERQYDVFSTCKSIVDQPDLDKNCSLIILLKVEEPEMNVALKSSILLIEENPFYFKKYILTYTQQEYDQLLTEKESKSELEFLRSKITNRECFNVYKANPKSAGWQSLVFRMALKFPFINISVSGKAGLNSLFDYNAIKLVSKNNNVLDDKVSAYISDKNVEVIGKLKPGEILKQLFIKPD